MLGLCRRRVLVALADIFHGPDVDVSSPDNVVEAADDEHCSVGQGGPIHGLGRRVVESREETHDKSQEEECDGGEVDGYPKFTEVKGAVEEWLMAEAAEDDAADGDEIGG